LWPLSFLFLVATTIQRVDPPARPPIASRYGPRDVPRGTDGNQIPTRGSPNPRNATKPFKIRDVNFTVPARVHVLACLVRNSFL
jgi:hypothetical protein